MVDKPSSQIQKWRLPCTWSTKSVWLRCRCYGIYNLNENVCARLYYSLEWEFFHKLLPPSRGCTRRNVFCAIPRNRSRIIATYVKIFFFWYSSVNRDKSVCFVIFFEIFILLVSFDFSTGCPIILEKNLKNISTIWSCYWPFERTRWSFHCSLKFYSLII